MKSNDLDLLHGNKFSLPPGELVEVMATYYPGMVRLYVPKKPFMKKSIDWEERDAPVRIEEKNGTMLNPTETSLERSIRRSQSVVNNLVLCNTFDLFVTLTVADEEKRMSEHKAKNVVLNWLKNLQKRKGKIDYILVPEYHKKGGLHFHLLISDYPGEIDVAINPWNGKRIKSHGRDVYNLPGYKSGWSTAVKVGNDIKDRAQVGHYIRKYITKDMVSIFNKKRYWASKGLNRPRVEYNPEWHEGKSPTIVYEGDFGWTWIYSCVNYDSLPEDVKLRYM